MILTLSRVAATREGCNTTFHSLPAPTLDAVTPGEFGFGGVQYIGAFLSRPEHRSRGHVHTDKASFGAHVRDECVHQQPNVKHFDSDGILMPTESCYQWEQ